MSIVPVPRLWDPKQVFPCFPNVSRFPGGGSKSPWRPPWSSLEGSGFAGSCRHLPRGTGSFRWEIPTSMGSKNHDHPRSIWTHDHIIIIQILWIILSYYIILSLSKNHDHNMIIWPFLNISSYDLTSLTMRFSSLLVASNGEYPSWRVTIVRSACQRVRVCPKIADLHTLPTFFICAHFFIIAFLHDTEFASSSYSVNIWYTQNTQMI